MTNEDAIMWLEDLKQDIGSPIIPENAWSYVQAIDEIIALLKEQEAKQAIKQTYHVIVNQDYENPVEVTYYDWRCPTCKSLLCRDIDVINDDYHFCKVCGQKVKWDD